MLVVYCFGFLTLLGDSRFPGVSHNGPLHVIRISTGCRSGDAWTVREANRYIATNRKGHSIRKFRWWNPQEIPTDPCLSENLKSYFSSIISIAGAPWKRLLRNGIHEYSTGQHPKKTLAKMAFDAAIFGNYTLRTACRRRMGLPSTKHLPVI